MTELLDAVDALGRGSLPVFWLPLLAWTLLAVPTYTILRRPERWHPLVQYRLQQALLFALPASIVATAWIDFSGFSHWLATHVTSPERTGAILLPLTPTVDGAAAVSHEASWLTVYRAVGLLTGLATLLAVVQLVHLLRSSVTIWRLNRADARHHHSAIHRQTQRMARRLGVRRRVVVQLAADGLVPMTYGVQRPTVVLPRSLVTAPDALRMTLTHELIHIRRFDFLARWIEQFVAALFAIHPGVVRLASSVESAREIACDAEAIRRSRCSPKAYADLLCGFATAPVRRPAFVLSIAESSSLKQRIRAMMSFDDHAEGLPRYASLLAGMLVLAMGFGVVACSDFISPPMPEIDRPEAAAAPKSEAPTDGPETATAPQAEISASPDEVFIVVEDRPELIGGMAALQEVIEYPAFAQAAGIEGRVFVQFTVDEQGAVRDAKVTRGVHKLLNEAALEAVRQMEFEPGRQRGRAVQVQMSLPVTFRLRGESPETASRSTRAHDLSSNVSASTEDDLAPLPLTVRADGSVLVDGVSTSLDNLTAAIRRYVEDSDADSYIALKVSPDTPMGTVYDIQSRLRDAGALKINYSTARIDESDRTSI